MTLSQREINIAIGVLELQSTAIQMNVRLCWPVHSNILITSSISFPAFRNWNTILNVCFIVTLSTGIPDAKTLNPVGLQQKVIDLHYCSTDNHYRTLAHWMFWCIRFFKLIILDDVYRMQIVYIINSEDFHKSL